MMYTSAAIKPEQIDNKPEFYRELCAVLESLIADEPDWIANLANASALLYDRLPELNWAGFYLMKPKTSGGEELVVGPFQGKPACTRIAIGKGVCGTTAAKRESVVVPDVNAFPGHIACDAASNSEIVVPMIKGEKVIGVLDIDSPKLARFDDEDREGLEAFIKVLMCRQA